ncbi:MAG TPA: DUF983 domain-containing protein [Chloroflexota bacterium]|nr:DUF983 domain-containing protein [Chloroflexota bacterium]
MSRVLRLFIRAVCLRCPYCGGGKIFFSWFSLKPSCPTCSLVFQRGEDGYFLGAWMINLIISESIPVLGILAAFLATYPSPPSLLLEISGALGAIALPLLFYPFSRTLWIALDLSIRPVSPDELIHHRGPDTGELRTEPCNDGQASLP